MAKENTTESYSHGIKSLVQQSSKVIQFNDEVDKLDRELHNEISYDFTKPKSRWDKIRAKGNAILHTRVVVLIIVFLTILDCIMVIGELILDMHAIKEDYIQHTRSNLADGCKDNGTLQTVLRARRASSDVNGSGGHDQHTMPVAEKVAHAFHYASVAILGALLFVIILKVLFQGKAFLRCKLELFDAFVVVASFVVDLVFLKGITTLPIQESAYILSYILPWRVIRVVNSLIVAVMDNEHYKLLLVYESKRHVTHRLKEAYGDLDIARKQVHAAKKMCIEGGAKEWAVNQVLLKTAEKHEAKLGKVSAIAAFASNTAAAMVNEKNALRAPRNQLGLGPSPVRRKSSVSVMLSNMRNKIGGRLSLADIREVEEEGKGHRLTVMQTTPEEP